MNLFSPAEKAAAIIMSFLKNGTKAGTFGTVEVQTFEGSAGGIYHVDLAEGAYPTVTAWTTAEGWRVSAGRYFCDDPDLETAIATVLT